MALRTTPLLRTKDAWVRADIDLDDLDEVVASNADDPRHEVEAWLRGGGLPGDGELVVFLEEDDWFAVVAVREAEVLRFASEYGAVMASEHGELFSDIPVDDRYGWAGDPNVLGGYGISDGVLADMAEVGLDPAMAVSELAETIGAVELLDEVE